MTAYNTLVMNADYDRYAEGDVRRAAAIAARFMGTAGNGGFFSFLTNSHSVAAEDVLAALEEIGAPVAAAQFRGVLSALGGPLPAASWEQRQADLDRMWSDALDRMDVLDEASDKDVFAALERHADAHAAHYLSLPPEGPPR
ncbi:MAG: DUF4375 domain-containing protein [Pseudomonadota bacterium]